MNLLDARPACRARRVAPALPRDDVSQNLRVAPPTPASAVTSARGVSHHPGGEHAITRLVRDDPRGRGGCRR
ncbi:hypothetical protein MIPYR_60099 [uncultured Microbacterium sp.]|uniref:Uncharacterized protein n=1 Tax=uncultured Microbacterium sp. TaxID=191216 RepID=A0A1Y5PAK8_9MICO|nr:hypothetical protein MIPYR_60099 [uncultured Microbacterium sp.]